MMAMQIQNYCDAIYPRGPCMILWRGEKGKRIVTLGGKFGMLQPKGKNGQGSTSFSNGRGEVNGLALRQSPTQMFVLSSRRHG